MSVTANTIAFTISIMTELGKALGLVRIITIGGESQGLL
jgi:hypothetical protein